MLINLRKHKTPFLILSMVVIYALQFLVFPKCLPQYYPVSNEAWFILIFPLLVFSVLTDILINANMARWAIADTAYCIMVIMYNGAGLYGIGRRGLAVDGMYPVYSFELTLITALTIAAVLFVFQMLVRAIRMLFLKVKK